MNGNSSVSADRRGCPAVEQTHLSHIQLLKSVRPVLRLNDGPFRVLHVICALLFAYYWFTHVPVADEGAGSTLPANLTLNVSGVGATQAPHSIIPPSVVDELDPVATGASVADPLLDVATDATGTDAGDEEDDEPKMPEMWEPQTPQDWVKLAWVVVCVLQALVNLFCVWMVDVKVACKYRKVTLLTAADALKVTPHQYHGHPEVVPLVRRKVKLSAKHTEELFEFDYRKMHFECDSERFVFEKVRFPTRNPIASYLTSTGFKADGDALAALEKWGPNRVEVPVPHFVALLQEQMLAPFFCFQVFCVLLWCLDEYLMYSLFTLFMLVVFESTVVFQRIRSLSELRALQVPKQHVYAHRGGAWTCIPGEMLLPGDVFSIRRPSPSLGKNEDEAVVPADALLIGGSCICDEAVLTGESTPQWKDPILDGNAASPDAAAALDIKRDKLHVLFGGTKVLQHTAAAKHKLRTPDGGALAVVLRTGYETAQGRLMRTILYSSERVSANTLETGLFICFLLVFAVSAAGYVLYHGLQEPPEKRSRFKLFLNCSMIITSVIPPELPMELTMAVNASLVALMKKSIFCTEPFRIPFAGKTEVCCFDKTGTLTSDNMVLQGLADAPGMPPPPDPPLAIAAGDDAIDYTLCNKPFLWPSEAVLVMATCHSLIMLDNELVGDPLEKASFEATGWSLDGNLITHGRRAKAAHVQKFHFSSELKRMSVVIRHEEFSGDVEHMVVAKGAPEVMEQFIDDCPPYYEREHRRHASNGARVIALAVKHLPPHLTTSDIKRMSRQEVESGLSFMGLAVFQTPLKEGSEPALAMLKESSHQLVMITGDAALTACFTAAKVHIVDRPVLILACSEGGATTTGHPEMDPSDDKFSWRSPDDAVVLPFQRSPQDLVALATQYDLCVTGDGLAHCQNAGVGDLVVALTQVFARVSPEQKEYVLKAHRAAGRVAFMCGDGTNDVGALKAAHVGVALMEPPAKEKVMEAMRAARAHHERKMKEARDALRGIAPPERPKVNSRGEPLAGAKLLAQFEASGKPVPEAMRKWADWLDAQDAGDDTGMPPMLKPGDASMASPFTVKAHDVRPCTDIIKQGRCTLVTTIQMFKILGLLCLSTAYSLSVLYHAGVKLGDVQATCQGMLSAGMFFFISNAKPLEHLSATRPHAHVFSRYVIISLLAQFAMQIALIIYMYNRSIALMDPAARGNSDSKFQPNLVNTVCYLVQNSMQLITFAVNYVGEPFQTPLSKNSGMLLSVRYGIIAVIILGTGALPAVNTYMQLVEIPLALRVEMFAGMLIVFAGSFVVERMLRAMLPARKPPQKGYLAYLHLLSPQASAQVVKKTQ